MLLDLQVIHDSTNKHVFKDPARDTGEGDWPVVGCTVHTLFEDRCDRGFLPVTLYHNINIYHSRELRFRIKVPVGSLERHVGWCMLAL